MISIAYCLNNSCNHASFIQLFLRVFFVLLVYSSACLPSTCHAQSTTISGIVLEIGSHEPVSFANVLLKGTTIGTLTDTSGRFTMTIDNNKIIEDSIVISHLIFDNKSVSFLRVAAQHVSIELKGNFLMLNEVVIKPGENPAWPILRKALANKSVNDRSKNTNYSCREYAKTRFDLNHFTEKLKNNILVKPFDYIWENVNTTDAGVKYLPLLLVEKVIDHHYQLDPSRQRDIIQASNTIGLPGKKMMAFTEDLYFTPSLYDNYVALLDKNFPSPLNDDYNAHYKFYLLDSFPTLSGKSYIIGFKPKSKRNLAFNGEMTIDSLSGALQSIKLQFNILANINFVRSYVIEQTFKEVYPNHWMLAESGVLGDFTVMENVSDMTGFFGRKKSIYSNYSFDNKETHHDLFDSPTTVLADSARSRSLDYWNDQRAESLSTEEKGIVRMVDRLEQDPKYKLRKNIIQSMLTGYLPMGSIEIGNIYSFYSANKIEKSRIKFGLQTNDKKIERWQAAAFGAYGTKDKKWKYGLESSIKLWQSQRQELILDFQYKNDLTQLGRSFNQLPFDHIFSSWVALSEIDFSFHYIDKLDIRLESNLAMGLSGSITYFQNKISRTKDLVFRKRIADDILIAIDEIKTAGMGLSLKYKWKNPSTSASFYQKSDLKNVFRKYPDIAFEWLFADQKTFKSDFDFQKIKLSLRQQVRIAKYGYSKYYLEIGKTFGTVPYSELNVPFGNPLVFYDDQAFNLMKYLEYVSDEFVSVDLQHHFDGIIMDHIPLINKLKWRSFIFGKAYYGKLSDRNQQAYLFPEGTKAANKPYYEVGFGFENIFKIARMDFIWRLTDTESDDVYRFLVKPSFSFSF